MTSSGLYAQIRITTTDQRDLLVVRAPEGFGLLMLNDGVRQMVSHYEAAYASGGCCVGLAWVEVPL